MPAPADDGLRLLHVHAHPDDESSKGAASTARYVSEGVRVMVATCTGGERGSILNPAMDRPDVVERIGEVRRAEMDRAREILGVEQVWLGFVDSGFPEGEPPPPLPDGCFGRAPLDEAVRRLVGVVRDFRPHVMTTYDENGGYPHPDHVRCHHVAVAAFDAAGDPDAFPEAGAAWQPLKLYYHHSFHRARTQALHDAMLARGLDSPYAERLAEWPPDPAHDRRITTKVPCAPWFPVRDDALRAHATQVDPAGPWFHVPLEVHQQTWPTEDYELVTSFVPASTPEDDLFAGLRDPTPRAATAAPLTRDDDRMTRAALAALGGQTTDQSLLEKYQPGPIALLVVVLLGVAVFLLWRSMRHQLRRIDFDETAQDDASRLRGPQSTPPEGGE